MKISELENQIDLYFLIAETHVLRKVGGEEYRVNPCPVCGGNDHFTVYTDTNSYSSFSKCCKGGKAYKYLQEVGGMTEDEAYIELQRLAGDPLQTVKKKSATVPQPTKTEETEALTPEDYTTKITELYHFQSDQDRAYFSNRGISPEIINKYKLCIGDMGSGRRAILPVWEDGKAIYYTGRALTDQQNPKYKNANGSAHLFNSRHITNPINQDPIIICEGIFDALSIEEVGGQAIALNSTSNVKKLLSLCAQYKPVGKLILALDNDPAGAKAKEELEKGLRGLGIGFKSFGFSSIYKDPNEYLIGDREALFGLVQGIIRQCATELARTKEEYQNTSTKNHVKNFFEQIREGQNTPAISTGFNELDRVLDGGFYAGLYVLGAISSLGKTSFILQVADQIAAQGEDVLIFSLEMARFELMAKSISRFTFLHDTTQYKVLAKTTRGITAGARYLNYAEKETDLIQLAVNEYGKIAGHVYILEGMGDLGVIEIKAAVDKHKSMTGKTPIIIIDYLQILAPYNDRASDKQNTDKAVLELKRISRDYKTPVIAISSLNRANYDTPINMGAYKESGSLEYGSDVLIGLQAKGAGTKEFNIDAAKLKDPREIELKVLKNRNGQTGGSIEYSYYPKFNYFEEVGR